ENIIWNALLFCFCCRQVLALVFIRKLLDFIFTKRELSWLDDLMPESKKKKMEDAEKEVS
ncbi:sodium-driven chloride bicarbonate exchanger-like, partial [Tachysurus ichikawai]